MTTTKKMTLREMRTSKNLTRKDVLRLLVKDHDMLISHNALQYWEDNRYTPNCVTLQALLEIYEQPISMIDFSEYLEMRRQIEHQKELAKENSDS